MRMLYKFPGAHLLEDGNRYDWCVVSEDEARGLLSGEWAYTYWDAKAKADKVVDDKKSAPLTRSELEELAKAKGIKVDGRWSDEKLAQKLA